MTIYEELAQELSVIYAMSKFRANFPPKPGMAQVIWNDYRAMYKRLIHLMQPLIEASLCEDPRV